MPAAYVASRRCDRPGGAATRPAGPPPPPNPEFVPCSYLTAITYALAHLAATSARHAIDNPTFHALAGITVSRALFVSQVVGLTA